MLNRLLLLRSSGGWVLKTESGVSWPQAWGEGTFVSLASALSAAA